MEGEGVEGRGKWRVERRRRQKKVTQVHTTYKAGPDQLLK